MATQRTRFKLIAPPGAHETNIDGHIYEPDDEEGAVYTTSETDLKVLQQHGYVLVGQGSTGQNRVTPTTKIDLDGGRGELAEALRDRDVVFEPTASRTALAELADHWNTGKLKPVAKIDPTPPAAAEPPAPADPKPGAEPPTTTTTERTVAQKIEDQDFESVPWDDLKGWLAGQGVGFPGNASKSKLVDIAKAYVASKQPAEAL